MPLRVHFNPEQSPRTGSDLGASARTVVGDWTARRFDLQLLDAPAATQVQLERAHAAPYVRRVLGDAGALTPVAVRETADAARHATGALIGAARGVCGRTRAITCAPLGAVHRAGWDFGAADAPFNALMVAALHLLHEGLAARVAILDLGLAYADGTVDILQRLARRDVAHYTAGAHWREPREAARFLRALPDIVRSLCVDDGMRADVLLYQAGADAHVDDDARGWLTGDQLRERDARVFDRCLELGVPVVWTLGGGRRSADRGGSAAVLATHRATLEEAQRALMQRTLAQRA